MGMEEAPRLASSLASQTEANEQTLRLRQDGAGIALAGGASGKLA